ncbi:MAG TPA: universal stress protein [Betaproteobacteria bacterium]|nr:universal stress protein [Betaproteobacteria bacterium]
MTNTMTGTILVAIDGSQNSMLAAGYAARLAKTLGIHLGMIYVLDMPAISFWAGIEERMKGDVRAQAEKSLMEISARIGEICEVVPEFYIVDGIPEEEVVKAVNDDPQIMMVVTGRDGISTEKRSLPRLRRVSGRFSSRLAEHLSVPLLVVPPDLATDHICPALTEFRVALDSRDKDPHL